jgi:hypothetical protein
MTSERKIAANRLNAKKSRGPRTAAGKSLASRNALRHGLRAITHRHPTPSSEIERFAKAICGVDNDPLLFEQACIIAENDFGLRAIHAQQLAVVERVQEVTAIALARGDNRLALAKARSLRSRLAHDELVALRDKLLLQYKDELPDPIEAQVDDLMGCYEQLVPEHLREFLLDKEKSSDPIDREAGVRNQANEGINERDEFAALEEAAADLIRLDRYERRAWSRQKRAIRDFMNMKLMSAIDAPRRQLQG